MSLQSYIEELEGQGRYWFLRNKAKATLALSEAALKSAIDRLVAKKKLAKLRDDFILIIPIEYKSWGIIPANWFIDAFMRSLATSYYIGLLTAASFYNASHQKPQIFQVITAKKYKPIKRKSLGLVFYGNSYLEAVPLNKMQVATGYVQVSSPEATALDLVKYYKVCGYLSNVATVLSELRESMQEERVLELVKKQIYSWSIVQRFGYLMEQNEVGGGNLVAGIATLIAEHNPRFVPLLPSTKYNPRLKDNKWRLFINEEIEVDL